MITENFILLNTDDNETISLWKVYDKAQSGNISIFLTHGTFSDKKICLGIAKYLSKKGYVCYILEWRNHGKSIKTNNNFNFETIALYDFKTTFTYLFEVQKIKKIHCITHSGGGIALTMFLIKNSIYKNRINSITFFACQVFGATMPKLNYLKTIISKLFTYLLGYIPAKKINLGSHNENYYMMKQWFDWNLKKNFLSTNKEFDYKENMKNIKIPIYSISAKGDKFIAPSIGCELFLKSFNNSENRFKEFSLENGHLENYNHSRIIMSKNSAKEIWPSVFKWIKKNER